MFQDKVIKSEIVEEKKQPFMSATIASITERMIKSTS